MIPWYSQDQISNSRTVSSESKPPLKWITVETVLLTMTINPSMHQHIIHISCRVVTFKDWSTTAAPDPSHLSFCIVGNWSLPESIYYLTSIHVTCVFHFVLSSACAHHVFSKGAESNTNPSNAVCTAMEEDLNYRKTFSFQTDRYVFFIKKYMYEC